MTTLFQNVKELLIFYVKTNYDKYLDDNNIKSIKDDEIKPVISGLYYDRKDHVKEFILQSLKKVLNEEYPGDVIVNGVLNEVFEDNELCINRLVIEIQLHQKNNND